MTRSPYGWSLAEPPPIIQQHSLAKHDILRGYLSAYIQTLVSNPNRDEFRLVLVDGFAGGGLYRDEHTRQPVLGSPFIMLEATKEAEAIINAGRRKRVRLDVDYYFVEKEREAADCLRKALKEYGYGARVDKDIFLLNCEFEDTADRLIERALTKMPRSPRAIFLLDQYGYSEVPADRIARIIQVLPGGEVILTFAVDALLTYFSENSHLTKRLLEKVGIPDVLRGRSFDDIKQTDKDWRLFVQACLYQELVEKCQAKFYTLFFIRSTQGHGDYWLIHFSQRARARDVMTRIHWEKNNHFIHYGGAGLDMFHVLGYVSENDDVRAGQSGLFEFDDVARQASTKQLVAQIAPLIYDDPNGMSFAELFATTCNFSPASADVYKDAVDVLRSHKEIKIISASTGKATNARVQDGDWIKVPDQRGLFDPR
jgi:three-Cys-motif partner protein